MSVRNTHREPRYDGLPKVFNSTGAHVGHAVPVCGRSLTVSAEQEAMHAMRRHVSTGAQSVPRASAVALERLTKSATGAPVAAGGHGGTINRVDIALNKAVCVAAFEGSMECLDALIEANAHNIRALGSPLAAAAIGRKEESARMLVRAGCSVSESVAQLKTLSDHEAAAWLHRF